MALLQGFHKHHLACFTVHAAQRPWRLSPVFLFYFFFPTKFILSRLWNQGAR